MKPRSVPILLAGATVAMLVWLGLRERWPVTDGPMTESSVPSAPPESGSEFEDRSEEVERALVGEASRQLVSPEASPSTATLIIRVVRSWSEDPIPEVRAVVWNPRTTPAVEGTRGPREESCAEGVTDDGGFLRLAVPPSVALRVELEGRGDPGAVSGDDPPFMGASAKVEPLSPGENRSLVIGVPHGWHATFWGRVVSDEDDLPITGARIWLFIHGKHANVLGDPEPSFGSQDRAVESDAGGRFEVRLTYSQLHGHDFIVAARGFSPGIFRPGTGHDQPGAARELRLRRSGTLRGRVIHANDPGQEPIMIRLETRANALSLERPRSFFEHAVPDLEWKASCDTADRFTFPVLPAGAPLAVAIFRGTKQVWTLPASSRDSLRPLEPGETREVTWMIDGGALVRGLALGPDLLPVPDHEVWLVRLPIAAATQPGPTCFLSDQDRDMVTLRARTDKEGRFSLEDVGEGRWWIGLAPPDLGGRRVEKPIPALAVPFHIAADQESADVEIRATGALYIRGRVVDPDGSPVAGAAIEGGPPEGISLQKARSDVLGAFEIGPLGPGPWRLQATMAFRFAPSPPVDVEAGTEDLVLKLVLGGTLAGQVFDRQSGAGSAALIHVVERGHGAGGFRFQVGANGFQFEALTPGTYDVVAYTENGLAGTTRGIQVAPGRTSTIRVEMNQAAELRVRGRSGPTGFALSCDGIPLGWQSVPGDATTSFTVLPGNVTLRIPRANGQYEEREVFVRAGQPTEIDL